MGEVGLISDRPGKSASICEAGNILDPRRHGYERGDGEEFTHLRKASIVSTMSITPSLVNASTHAFALHIAQGPL